MSVLPELTSRVSTIEDENVKLRAELEILKTQCDLQDQHQKSKNLIVYGMPGNAGEQRSHSELLISKLCSKCGIRRRVVQAHRLGQKPNSPMMIQFECKADAQEAFALIRKAQPTLRDIGLGDEGKIEVRYHLSSFLSELLRTANIVKKEANLGFCRALTSNQTVEIFHIKEPGSPKIIVRSFQEVLELKDKLLSEGRIATSSPAATLEKTSRPQRKRARAVPDKGAQASDESAHKRR